MKLLVVGSSNIDLVLYLPKIPMIGETVLGGESNTFYGGKGANQALAALYTEVQMGFITKVGKDDFGNQLKKHFIKEGLNKQFILTDEKAPTGLAQIFVSEKGENSIGVASGANSKLTFDDILLFKDYFINIKYVLAQLETPIETIEALGSYTKKNSIRMILNPAPAQKLSENLYQNTWLLTPNETEITLLTGVVINNLKDTIEAGKILIQRGVKNIIVTLGKEGSVLINKKENIHYRAYRETVVDTTAAGDVFNGVLASALAKDKSLHESICYAMAAATLSIGKKGAQSSIPKLTEIERFISVKGIVESIKL